MIAVACIVTLSTRALRHHDLLVQQHTSLAATCREQVLLQGSLDGLDEYGTGGFIHFDLAHRTLSVAAPSSRVGLCLIPTAGTAMLTVSSRDCVVEDKRKSRRWLWELIGKGTFKFLAFDIIQICNRSLQHMETKSASFLRF